MDSKANSAILELDFKGIVRYASKEWLPITGISASKMVGRSISDFVDMADKDIFQRAISEMSQPNFPNQSVTIWATMRDMGNADGAGVQIEAQGITVDLNLKGNAVIFLVSEYLQRPQVSVLLPDELVRTTGFATDVFATYLETLADSVRAKTESVPAPPQELCRICEQFVKRWWFERHHWLCAVEHKYLERVRYTLDLLHDHREDLEQVHLQVTHQIKMQPPAATKHAVHVPSPLARSVTSDVEGSDNGGDEGEQVPTVRKSSLNSNSVPKEHSHHYYPLQHILGTMIERCDFITQLDPETVDARADGTDTISLYGKENSRILQLFKEWQPIPNVPKMLEYSLDVTKELINGVVASFERYAKFLRYKRVLWGEVESQVVATIEATISAAENNDATVIIDQAEVQEESDEVEAMSPSSLPISPRTKVMGRTSMSFAEFSDADTDVDQPSHNHSTSTTSNSRNNRLSTDQIDINFSVYSESDHPDNNGALYSDDEDEMKYILNLKRQRSVHSRRSSYDSSIRSPHLSPHLSPHMGPSNMYLSPKIPAPYPSQYQHQPSPQPPTPFQLNSYNNSSASSSSSLPTLAQRRLSRSIVSTAQNTSNENLGGQELTPSPAQSIRDYEIIKPISRGAYGVVYLAKKRVTSDLVAIKVLKKSQMVAKNQVTHIKHERRILISTARSPYVATLYYTFQSRDYLYLVMEYVPGGDVAALLKKVGCLSETWAKQYISEVIVAVESLHAQGILHRDLKPDNLLIDKRGHLKLSDFGLSSARTQLKLRKVKSRTESISSKQASPTPSTASGASDEFIKATGNANSTPSKILGTPDYLAPETIEGKVELTGAADWWAVGCIFFELVYGYPPFNDETPQRIFNNILKCDYTWPTLPPEMDISSGAKKFITELLVLNPDKRLGANGSQEVMKHPYFGNEGIQADTLFQQAPEYIPEASNPLSTSNFDDRGARELMLPAQETNLIFSINESDVNALGGIRRHSMVRREQSVSSQSSNDLTYTSPARHYRTDSRTSESSMDEFGNFNYRNLPVLEKANNDVITKIRDEDRRLSFSGSVSPLILPSSPSHGTYGSPLSSAADLNLNSSDHLDDMRRPASPSIVVSTPAPRPLSVSSEGSVLSRSASRSSLSKIPTHVIIPQIEEPEKDIAFLRMRHRQQLRRMPKSGKQSTNPNVLVCGSHTLRDKLAKLDCNVIHCDDANDACIQATSPLPLNLIILDLPENASIPDTEVVRIIRGTVNPNRDVPIYKVSNANVDDPLLPTFDINNTFELERLVRMFCQPDSPIQLPQKQ